MENFNPNEDIKNNVDLIIFCKKFELYNMSSYKNIQQFWDDIVTKYCVKNLIKTQNYN